MLTTTKFLMITLVIFTVASLSTTAFDNSVKRYLERGEKKIDENYYYSNYYRKNNISISISYQNPHTDNYKLVYSSIEIYNQFNLNFYISLESKNSTRAILMLNTPNAYYIYSFWVIYLCISEIFPYFQIEQVHLNVLTNSSGIGILNTAVASSSPMLNSTYYQANYIGINVKYTGAYYKYAILTLLSWSNSTSINVFINVNCSANFLANISFFILHWNSSSFNDNAGTYGTISITSFLPNSNLNLPLNSSQLIYYSINLLICKYCVDMCFTVYYSGTSLVFRRYCSDFVGNYTIVTFSRLSRCNPITPYIVIFPYSFNSSNKTCLNSCPINYGTIASNWTCLKCLYDCTTCTVARYCSFCDTNTTNRYFDFNTQRCLPLKGFADIGLYVAVPCSSGCIICINIYICLQCNDSKLWIVTGYCTNIIGCLVVNAINYVNFCSLCDSKEYFVPFNNTCICAKGFNFISPTCIDICGDGMNFQYECDDGNNIDGDGCSSNCIVQHNFQCSKTIYTPSVCIFYTRNSQIALVSTNKVQGRNAVKFIFKITPQIYFFQQKGSIDNITLDFSANVSIQSWSQDKGVVTVFVNYTEDLQGKIASIQVFLHSNRTLERNLTLIFEVHSDGEELYYSANPSSTKFIQTALRVFFGISLGVFFLSLFSHKIIGVKMANSFQIVYFLTFFNLRPTYPSQIYQNMAYVNLNFLYSSSNKVSNFYYEKRFKQFSKDALGVSKMTVAIVMAVGVILILIKVVAAKLVDKSNKQEWFLRLCKTSDLVYHRLLFPLGIGFFYLNCFSETRHSSVRKTDDSVGGLETLIAYIVCGVVYFNEFLPPKTKACGTATCHSRYIPCYLLYMTLIHTVLALGSLSIVKVVAESVSVLSLLFLVGFLINRPYLSAIHNVGEVVNTLIILTYSSWIAVKNYILIEDNVQYLFLYAVMLPFMALSVLLTLAGSIFQMKQHFCINQTQKRNQKIKKRKPKLNYEQNVIQGRESNNFKNRLISQIEEREIVVFQKQQTAVNRVFNFSVPMNTNSFPFLLEPTLNPKNSLEEELIKKMRQKIRNSRCSKYVNN